LETLFAEFQLFEHRGEFGGAGSHCLLQTQAMVLQGLHGIQALPVQQAHADLVGDLATEGDFVQRPVMRSV